jgi:hypothetical protein
MPDDVRALDAELIHDAGHVAEEDRKGVVLDRLGLVRSAEAPQVGRDYPEAGVGESGGSGGARDATSRGSREVAGRKRPSPPRQCEEPSRLLSWSSPACGLIARPQAGRQIARSQAKRYEPCRTIVEETSNLSHADLDLAVCGRHHGRLDRRFPLARQVHFVVQTKKLRCLGFVSPFSGERRVRFVSNPGDSCS